MSSFNFHKFWILLSKYKYFGCVWCKYGFSLKKKGHLTDCTMSYQIKFFSNKKVAECVYDDTQSWQ